jgi:SMC interacting uncharacterized protein involved in chromosome segregation
LQERYDARKAALLELLKQRKRSQIQMEIIKVETVLKALKEQENELKAQVDAKRKDAEKFGRSSIDVEVLRGELKTLEAVLTQISTQRDKLSVEMRNASRVTLICPAEVPEAPNSWF